MYDLKESNCPHLYENSWNLLSEKVHFCITMYDLEDPICMKMVEICRVRSLYLYQGVWFGGIKLSPFVWIWLKSANEKFYFVSTCMIWRNQIIPICMKIVEICRVKRLLLINMYDLEESNCPHLNENSWNLPSEKIAFVLICMIWRNHIVPICMKIV